MYSRKSALSQAKVFRTCPPSHIANDFRYKSDMQRHAAICPYCSLQVREEQKRWEKLTALIQDTLTANASPPHDDDNISPGQLRHIKAERGRWHEGYFYNPPLVLVIESFSQDVRVAQTYHDIYLAGPGDLILSEEQTGIMPLFAECRNTYWVKAAHLDRPAGKTDADIATIVNRLARDTPAYPDRALQPKPFADQDVRIYFRELEAQVAEMFNIRDTPPACPYGRSDRPE
jgi:hypothetical protein